MSAREGKGSSRRARCSYHTQVACPTAHEPAEAASRAQARLARPDPDTAAQAQLGRGHQRRHQLGQVGGQLHLLAADRTDHQEGKERQAGPDGQPQRELEPVPAPRFLTSLAPVDRQVGPGDGGDEAA
jgi:hypothetical protein